MSQRAYYITTAIDYANGQPHLGHALEKIGADAVARYRRLKGDAVHFVIGMDEHGQNILQSAQRAGQEPREYVEGIARDFSRVWELLGISNDDFIRTTEERHHRAVAEMIRRIHESGDLYRGTYSGYYCVRCEAYKTEDQLERPEATGEPRCPLHPSFEIAWTEEENWFFRLSRYQPRLLQLLDEHPELVQPEIRRNEIRRVIEGGLEDISVSRSIPWGVPWPGEPDQTVYVWLDALTNYLSATGFPEESYEELWPASLHVIGKDITRFHCIYWPAFLMSAGIELPRTVWAHGFVSYGGRRMSKSEGVGMELDEAIERHGPEALRYYLLREVPWNGDGDITRERFDERYTAELANDIGNLASRTIAMVVKYRDGVVPSGAGTELDQRIADAVVRFRAAMDAHLLHQGIQVALELAGSANGFVGEREPWRQAKDAALSGELDATLSSLIRALATLATLLSPFLPRTMEMLAQRIGLQRVPALADIAELDPAGGRVTRGEVLFPRPEL